MKPLRTLDRATRRARLIAARPYPIGGIVRRGIIDGQWDGGDVVRRAAETAPLASWQAEVEAQEAARREPDCVGGVYASQPFAARNYDDIREDV